MVVRVIYGPPAAGKSTYIAEHKREGDIVIDMDALCVALGSPDSHKHPDHLKAIAGAARAIAIRKTIERGVDGWVVDTHLTSKAILEHSAQCEFILVDPGETVALRRAESAGRPQGSINAIRKWYADPPVPPANARTGTTENPPAADLGTAVVDWW